MAKFSTCEFSVVGTSPFPTDMLRYDGCYPACERDSHLLDLTISRYEPGPITVKLRSKEEAVIRRGPTLGRWKSFGWEVVADSIQRK